MVRKRRIDFPGALHHVMNRGARREPIFRGDAEGLLFLELLGDMVRRAGVQVLAFALMPNQYHLLVRSVRGNLSDAMKDFGAAYTRRVNAMHQWDGPVFRGRFHSELIADDDHFKAVVAYIHLGPARAGLVARPDDDRWTSHRRCLSLDQRPAWLSVDEVLDRFGDAEALDDHLRELQSGERPWPAELDLDTGRLRRPTRRAEGGGGRPETPPSSPDEVLRRVGDLTGVLERRILTPRKGRAGNQARRFAVWALRRDAGLTQAGVGRELGMSPTHVAKILRQLASTPSGAVKGWMRAWVSGAGLGPDEAR